VSIGRVLIIAGVFLVVVGLVVTLSGRLPMRIGRLPGDIYVHGRHGSFYFPIVTCVLAILVLSLVIWLFRR
jgi:hypothetical protein